MGIKKNPARVKIFDADGYVRIVANGKIILEENSPYPERVVEALCDAFNITHDYEEVSSGFFYS